MNQRLKPLLVMQNPPSRVGNLSPRGGGMRKAQASPTVKQIFLLILILVRVRVASRREGGLCIISDDFNRAEHRIKPHFLET